MRAVFGAHFFGCWKGNPWIMLNPHIKRSNFNKILLNDYRIDRRHKQIQPNTTIVKFKIGNRRRKIDIFFLMPFNDWHKFKMKVEKFFLDCVTALKRFIHKQKWNDFNNKCIKWLNDCALKTFDSYFSLLYSSLFFHFLSLNSQILSFN